MTDETLLADNIGALLARHGDRLTPMSAGLLAVRHLGIARDSRTFAKTFDVAHALVIRECVMLADELALIELEDRQDRSQRLFFDLTDKGRTMFEAVPVPL